MGTQGCKYVTSAIDSEGNKENFYTLIELKERDVIITDRGKYTVIYNSLRKANPEETTYRHLNVAHINGKEVNDVDLRVFQGKIENYPKELVKLMLQRQLDEAGECSIDSLELLGCDDFSWDKTPEGIKFWSGVYNDYNHFYTLYPKKEEESEEPEYITLAKSMTDIPESLKDFPKEVLGRILYEQTLQENKPDLSVFEGSRFCSTEQGGFSWHKTEHPRLFWNFVLVDKNFNLFFEKYPYRLKESTPESTPNYGNIYPKEVVEKIWEKQIECGNKPNITIIEENSYANRKAGGFLWGGTREGNLFWKEVIINKNYETFYKMYPKLDTTKEETRNTIKVIYTNMRVPKDRLGSYKQYVFHSKELYKVGDLISSPDYTTNMQVVGVIVGRTTTSVSGIPVKTLNATVISEAPESELTYLTPSYIEEEKQEQIINNKTNKVMKKSMMNTMVEKFKSQFMPTRIEGLKVSMTGDLCVPVNGEMVGMDAKGNLTNYPEETCFDMPVFTINKPISQINVGDVVKFKETYSKVIGINKDKSLRCVTFSGYTQTKKEIKDFLLGQALVTVVVNMFQGMNVEANNQINPMMFMFMDKDGSESSKIEVIMMMSMMMQQTQGASVVGNPFGQMNPMILMMMLKEDESSDMVSMMMMSQMMGGQNPFATMIQPQEITKK